MKAAFIHDHPFIDYNSSFYSQGGLPAAVWKRYLPTFNSLLVVGRMKSFNTVPNIDNLVMSSTENVNFRLCSRYNSPIDILINTNSIKTQIKEFFVEEKVTHVIIRLPSVLGFIARDICLDLKLPFLIEVVGSAYNTLRYSGIIQKAYGKLLDLKMRKVVANAPYVIYVTKEFLQSEYPSTGRWESISNVKLGEVEGSILKQRIKNINLRESKTIKLGLIGSMNVPYKGHKELLKAISLLPKNIRDRISVEFVGQGNPDWIIRLATSLGIFDNVVIAGQLTAGESINKFLDNIDIYVHPSKSEGLPRVVVEACARACPVLASTTGGIPELINQLHLHKPGDFRELSVQIRNLVDNKSAWAIMANENFETSKQYSEIALDSKRQAILGEFVKKSSSGI